MSQLVINEENWPVFASRIASPSPPDEHCEVAIERLVDFIHPWIVDVKNVRPQFKAINKILMIDFESPMEKEYYDRAYERYLTETAKIKSEGEGTGAFAILVEWLKFRQAAEFIRRKYLARRMYHAVQEGYAAGCACNFKATIAGIVLELHNTYKVPRSSISLIWGGDSIYTSSPDRHLYTDEEIQDILGKMMRGEETRVSVLNNIKKQLQAQNAGLGQVPAYLNLGPQNFKDRQEEIDRFQRGTSLYGIFNFKSGGIGLSLHHSDQLTKEKCRRKPNGYVYTEDIPNIPTRPRLSFIAPTYSAIELVQGLGRFPRISSLSDTIQTMVFYKGTIESLVAATVSQKLKCLTKVVRQREDWQDIVTKTPPNSLRSNPIIPDEETIADNNELFNINVEDDDNEDDEE